AVSRTAIAPTFACDEIASIRIESELQSDPYRQHEFSGGPFSEWNSVQVLDVGVHVGAAVPTHAKCEIDCAAISDTDHELSGDFCTDHPSDAELFIQGG